MGTLAAFPVVPWAGFVFAGGIVGELVDAVRDSSGRDRRLQLGLAVASAAGIWVAWHASFQPALYPTARFWHDSPTFFFIRLGLATVMMPVTWVLTRMLPVAALEPVAALGRSSLFVYWIHIEMVYGVLAEPLKRQLALWQSLIATALLLIVLYWIVRLKNRLLATYGLRGPLRLLAPVLR